MPVIAVIPFKPVNPKTRLSCLLDQREREAFAEAMLDDVITAVRGTGCDICVLSTSSYSRPGTRVVVDERGLNESLNDFIASSSDPVLVIMADLPLATPEAVNDMLQREGDVVFAPGRGGGTNAIFVRAVRDFHVDYYGASFLKHVRIAGESGLSIGISDSFRLHTDIDEKEDLVELLIHGKGESRRFLESSGFSLKVEKGRVGVERVQ
ncbi:MAG: 2-phospho-L-lactate guanylyltransferase [Methanoregulaceae archaeon]|nr:2-phospho-L-lactate guanylyltransferase [Methanoregulaceae archaeon]